jgi:decaprenyl-phosphate phosphoribosyltransferase
VKSKSYWFINTLRIQQWPKNFLVCVAPFSAGALFENIGTLVLSTTLFCLASSFGYTVNDWIDKAIDSQNPKRLNRPFASGQFGLPQFSLLLIILFTPILILMLYLPIKFVFCVIIYMIISISYSIKFKQIPVVELFFVSSGFLLRSISGAFIFDLEISSWLLLVTGSGSMLVISSKRLSEKNSKSNIIHRPVLREYESHYLRSLTQIATATCLVSYALWVFNTHPNSAFVTSTIVPFSTLLFAYLKEGEGNKGENPESVISTSPLMLGCIFLLFLLLFLDFYVW